MEPPASQESRFRLDDFELYRAARAFRNKIYALIRQLPPEERYCLASQMRRAALSVSNNVAEGHGRWHFKENIHFCRIARGSIDECIDDLNTCLDQGYSRAVELEALKCEAYDLVRRINSYVAYLRKSQQGNDD